MGSQELALLLEELEEVICLARWAPKLADLEGLAEGFEAVY